MKKFIKKDLDFFHKLCIKKNYKRYFIIFKLCNRYGARVISDHEIIKMISSKTGIEGKRIKWFIDNVWIEKERKK